MSDTLFIHSSPITFPKTDKEANMKRFMAILFLFLLAPTLIASAELTKGEIKEIQEIMRQELQRMDKRFDDINKRFDDMNNRINDMNNRISEVNNSINDRIDNMNNLMLWGFGVIFAGMFALLGFVIWDRRTALAPAIRNNKELEERQERIEKALKEFAIEEPKLAEILKQMRI
jgi:predicted PurR-regulated permease PerM